MMKRSCKIFFNSSARGSSEAEANCKKIYRYLSSFSNYNLTYDTFGDGNSKEFYSFSRSRIKAIFLRATEALKNSDLCILEISTHSLSQGYLLEKALEEGKPTIALHLPNCLPVFVAGIHDSRLQVVEYTSENLIAVLEEAINYASEEFDIRFNMMLSPTLNNYLKELAKQKNVSRSSCVRALIRENMMTEQAHLG